MERKQLEMALGPGIVCQQLPNRTMVPSWRLLETWAGHVTHIKANLSLKSAAMVTVGHFVVSVLSALDERFLTSWSLLFMSVINLFMDPRTIKLPLIIFPG